ncbi:MAG TPA: hypothetical protein VKT28_20835 [Puia sp.]|nr:hypothetical protein [Puia sp.]
MSTYLLLRDNKQSGPFSLDEIKAKGFKKYDLVWVDGKSAAWRYPGEIDELKAFAPIVEEQPFDRFFKKPSEEKKETKTVQAQPAKKETVTIALVANKVVAGNGAKKIYASLPAKKASAASSLQSTFISQPVKEEIRKPITEQVINNNLQENIQELFPDQSLNHSKEINIPSKTSRSSHHRLQIAAVAACIVVLLGGGIFIGMSINKSSLNPISNNDPSDKQMAKVDKQDHQNALIPISTSVPLDDKSVAQNTQGSSLDNSSTAITDIKPAQSNEEKKNAQAIEKKKSAKLKTNAATDIPKIIPERESVTETDSSGLASRHSTHRADIINDKELIKSNIANLVSVSSNKFSVGTFGGISELQLTVNNRSVYPLDLVMVEVQYVQANKKVYKTENVYYRNVRPGESIMQEAPKSSRGVKVQYRVALINSKEPSVSYSGI